VATQTHVTIVDDLDGSAARETVSFGLDGASYEIDLNDKNAKKLRDALAVYVANSRQVGGGRGRARGGRAKAAKAGNSKEQLAAIRQWARKNGYEVSDRGRLSTAVMQAFDEAH
jgi:hypothetical protein